MGTSGYPEQNTAMWRHTRLQLLSAQGDLLFSFSPLTHPDEFLGPGPGMPAEPAVSAGLEGRCGGWERAAGKREGMWQHGEPVGLPSSVLKPEPKRERLPVINERFLSLAPFGDSI